MKSGTFISLIASTYHVEEKTVTVFARFLREAGLLTTGARGVNAPHMLPLDAARMTIALLSTDSPARAVSRVKRFGQLPLRLDRCEGDLNIPLLEGEGITFEKVLTRYFAVGRDENMPEYVEGTPDVEVYENARKAVLNWGRGYRVATFMEPKQSDEVIDKDWREMSGIIRMRGLDSAHLIMVVMDLWTDRYLGEDEQGQSLRLADEVYLSLSDEERDVRRRQIDAYFAKREPEWRKGTV